MTGGAFSPATRRRIIDRSDGACVVCSTTVVETVGYGVLRPCALHHRLPRRRGGRRGFMAGVTASPANGLLLCVRDHARIEADAVVAQSFGWVLTEGQNPTEVAVFHLGEWCLLDATGNAHPVAGAA